MIRNAVPLLLLAAVGTAGAQELEIPEVPTPRLPEHAATVEAFVPKGWTVEERLTGPVDADAKPDVVLLLRDADPRNVLHNEGLGVPQLDTNPRVLLVLLADPAGGWRRVAQSDTVIRRNDMPTLSDAYEDGGLTLDKRVLGVTVGFFANAGSWTASHTTYKFRWQDGCMRLIGFDESVLNRGSGETTDTSVNLLTRKATRAVGNMEVDGSVQHRYALKPRPPVCLKAVNDEFDPGIPAD